MSSIIRGLYDDGNPAPLTKNTRTRTTDAHVGIITHTTTFELTALLSQTEQLNGFGNRFCWVCSRRQGVVPFPTPLSDEFLTRIRGLISDRRVRADYVSKMTWSRDARDLYRTEYPELSRAHGGVAGCMVNRGEAMTVRLAMIYSLLAGRETLEIEDLQAALAAWRYCRDSALFLFGDTPANRRVTQIMAALAGGPMSKQEIRRNIFSDHIQRQDLDGLLAQMESEKLIIVEKVSTNGRPETRISKYSGVKSVLSVISPDPATLNTHITHITQGENIFSLSEPPPMDDCYLESLMEVSA